MKFAIIAPSYPTIQTKFIGFFLLFLSISFVGQAQSKYINTYKGIADSLSKEYNIPLKVIFGIALIESSNGTSRNCRLLKNHFGIVGKNNLLQTI